MEIEEIDAALDDAEQASTTSPEAAARRTKVKQRWFFGEFPSADGVNDRKDALGIPKSSLGVLNDKGTMAVPGMSSAHPTLPP